MTTAGIGTRKMKTSVKIWERGYRSRYAPITPEIAPLAPSDGKRRVQVEERRAAVPPQFRNEVEAQVGEVAVEVLHVVAKDPEEQHIAQEVRDAGMQKHAC